MTARSSHGARVPEEVCSGLAMGPGFPPIVPCVTRTGTGGGDEYDPGTRSVQDRATGSSPQLGGVSDA